MAGDLEFGLAGPGELETMVTWAAQEGWNPGNHDAACFHAADPEGFWIARQNGEMAACISLVTYSDKFAFLGFYITRPDLRGQGIGHALWQHVLHACTATTIGLDGVVDQQDNYRKSGFVLAHRNIRYGGTPTPTGPLEADIRPFEPSDLPALEAFDEYHFPGPRPAFLTTWMSMQGHTALLARDGTDITGYGVIRPCLEGHKIGPLFAKLPEIAESLFDGLVSHAGAGTVFIDPPEPNAAAVELCRRRGLAPVFETARMYRGNAPELPLSRTFGISSFELG